MVDPADETIAIDRAVFTLRAAYAGDARVAVMGNREWIKVVFQGVGVDMTAERTARDITRNFNVPIGFEIIDIDFGPTTTTVFVGPMEVGS